MTMQTLLDSNRWISWEPIVQFWHLTPLSKGRGQYNWMTPSPTIAIALYSQQSAIDTVCRQLTYFLWNPLLPTIHDCKHDCEISKCCPDTGLSFHGGFKWSNTTLMTKTTNKRHNLWLLLEKEKFVLSPLDVRVLVSDLVWTVGVSAFMMYSLCR